MAAPFERPAQGQLVGIFEITTDGQTGRDSRHHETWDVEQSLKVQRRSLAFEVWVRTQDHLSNPFISDAGKQFLDAKTVWTNPLKVVDRSAENVIAAAKTSSPLYCDDVLRLLHDAEHGKVPTLVSADIAFLPFRDVEATITKADLFFDLGDRHREAIGLGLVGVE